jgi:hypothetical protein
MRILTFSVKPVLMEQGEDKVFAGFTRIPLKITGRGAGISDGRPAGASVSPFLSVLLFSVSLVLSIS